MTIKRFFFMVLMTVVIGVQNVRAQSTVYFFIDFRFWNPEYMFKVNGEYSFSLKPELGKLDLYNMCARKVIFQNPDSYVISVECPSVRGTYQADVNLNLEDGETYYVICNSTMKRNFYMEVIPEKEGLKMLKKSQKSNKYTVNEDYVYTN